jgi:c-di-AMP phosphodiesterase-like protein
MDDLYVERQMGQMILTLLLGVIFFLIIATEGGRMLAAVLTVVFIAFVVKIMLLTVAIKKNPVALEKRANDTLDKLLSKHSHVPNHPNEDKRVPGHVQ